MDSHRALKTSEVRCDSDTKARPLTRGCIANVCSRGLRTTDQVSRPRSGWMANVGSNPAGATTLSLGLLAGQATGILLHYLPPCCSRVAEWRHLVPFAPTDSLLAGYVRYNSALRSVTSAYGVPFIPMLQLGIAGTAYYGFGDPIHFNDRGAERFARGLATQLVQRNLIPARSAARVPR